ncbi:glutaredoxin family protein, partial [Methylibium sp. T29]|uniref:glutaredoxin family protein n=1 Tax=Methylibium sp. T29 TaxID=1430884 RepID=UPI0006857C1E
MSRSAAVLLFSLVALGSGPALAQYKIVEPDGRITYTDRPAPSAAAKVQPIRGGAAVTGTTSGLPYELAQIAERYPVTLYSGSDCSGCVAGRDMLRQRGIPYTEKTITGEADIAAFRQIESSAELPVLRIGGQQLRGYSEPNGAATSTPPATPSSRACRPPTAAGSRPRWWVRPRRRGPLRRRAPP